MTAGQLTAQIRDDGVDRAGLRDRMKASPLRDAPRFMRNLEAVSRRIWRNWCGAER